MKLRFFRPGLFGWSDGFFAVGLAAAVAGMVAGHDALWKAAGIAWLFSLIFEFAAKAADRKAGR